MPSPFGVVGVPSGVKCLRTGTTLGVTFEPKACEHKRLKRGTYVKGGKVEGACLGVNLMGGAEK